MQSFDLGAEVEVLTFNALGELLGNEMLVFQQQTVISAPVIGAEQMEVETLYSVQQYFQRVITP